jgi:hypothetical protein
MISAVWAWVSSARSGVPEPSATGDVAAAFAALGQIIGAVYSAWTLGDGVSLSKNKPLKEIIKEKFWSALVAIVGSQLAGKLGETIANQFGAWVGGATGPLLVGIGYGIVTGADVIDVARDSALGLAQTGLNFVKGIAGLEVSGIAFGVGIYSGVVEYESDTAFNWWKLSDRSVDE